MLEINKYYNMDCMEGMKQFPDKFFELAIVDPPYGIGIGWDGMGVITDAGHYEDKGWNNSIPNKEYFDELYRVSKNQIIWGCNFYGGFIKGAGRIVWDKKGRNHVFSHCDIAYQSFNNNNYMYEFVWIGCMRGKGEKKEKRIHPTQKPIQLYIHCLTKWAKPNDKILDTHVGSGSSIIAFKKHNFDYVGFEIDKDYYKDSSKRINDFKFSNIEYF